MKEKLLDDDDDDHILESQKKIGKRGRQEEGIIDVVGTEDSTD